MPNPPLNQLLVRRLFNFGAYTGKLTWRISGHSVSVGQEAGKDDGKNGRRVRINYFRYKVSNVIWVWLYGHWPKGKPYEVIDHIDRNPYNNRLNNLRLVTDKQNGRNRDINYNNTTGFSGVILDGRTGKYVANLGVDNRRIYCGTYLTAEEAAEAIERARKEHWK